jgi:subtilisin family serine protease
MRFSTRLVLCAFLFAIIQPAFSQQAKKKLETAEQLPVHSYPLSGKASDVLNNDVAFARLTSALQKDLINELQTYDIEDKSTVKSYYNSLMQIACLDGHYDEALSYLQKGNALEDKPAAQAMAGLVEEPLINAAKARTEPQKVFETEFADRVKKLPYDTVQSAVKLRKAWLELISPNYLTGMVEQRYDTLAQKTGKIPQAAAMDLVNTRFAIRAVLPHQEFMAQQLRALIAAHHIEKKDIWAERTVTLTESDRLTPTVIAIWDGGVDPSVFPGRMWINTKEIPNNGKDDDGNGYTDDVYGIGWDWYGRKNIGPLRELHVPQAEIDTYKHYSKGFGDMEASLDTPEATEARKKFSKLPKEEVQGFMDGLSLYGEYAHGTEVAGIALDGNPAGRVLVIREDWAYQSIPPSPNQEWANGWVTMLRESVRYLRDNGARTVNMSWGISAQEIEDDMEASGTGGTVDERHATASRYFTMLNASFMEAIKGAPNVLFVASAGNSNDDARFNQEIPAAFDLPNTMTVGAVDQGGDETSFTSFGKVDVYTNGYHVDSVVPGGDHESASGTSEAAPQVTNLAAKLLAKYPQLTAVQLKKFILDGTDEKELTGRRIRLLNEKRSFELAAQNAATK